MSRIERINADQDQPSGIEEIRHTTQFVISTIQARIVISTIQARRAVRE